MSSTAVAGRTGARTVAASLGTRSRKGVETSGKLAVLAIESVVAGVTVIVARRFSWTEFMLQAWFMTRVSLLPTILVAIPFGLRASFLGVVLTILLVCVLAMGLAAASYSMGLILRDEDSFAPVIQSLTLPLLLLSGVFLPMSLAPTWLRRTSQANPLSYVVDGSRSLFAGDIASGDTAAAVVATVSVTAALLWWGTRRFQRNSS